MTNSSWLGQGCLNFKAESFTSRRPTQSFGNQDHWSPEFLGMALATVCYWLLYSTCPGHCRHCTSPRSLLLGSAQAAGPGHRGSVCFAGGNAGEATHTEGARLGEVPWAMGARASGEPCVPQKPTWWPRLNQEANPSLLPAYKDNYLKTQSNCHKASRRGVIGGEWQNVYNMGRVLF